MKNRARTINFSGTETKALRFGRKFLSAALAAALLVFAPGLGRDEALAALRGQTGAAQAPVAVPGLVGGLGIVQVPIKLAPSALAAVSPALQTVTGAVASAMLAMPPPAAVQARPIAPAAAASAPSARGQLAQAASAAPADAGKTAALFDGAQPLSSTAETEPAEEAAAEGVPYLVRGPQDLEGPVIRDGLVRVPGAKVAYHNREALGRDFPFTKTLSDRQLDAWILDEFAFISRTQHALDGVRNSPIPVPDLKDKKNRKLGYRPTGYGRASVLAVRDPRAGTRPVLVDVKGIGRHRRHWENVRSQIAQFQIEQEDSASSDALRVSGHSDGLMSLGEAIAELTRQQAAQKLFAEHNAAQGTSLRTVDTYFIIALPFSILKDEDRRIPAALYGRQAHYGRTMSYAVPENIYADDHGGRQSDNLGAAAVDFGGVVIKDPRLSGNFGTEADPQSSKAWRYAHDAAAAFSRSDDPDVSVVYRHLEEMLKPLSGSSLPAQPSRRPDLVRLLERALADDGADIGSAIVNALQGRSDEKSLSLVERALADSRLYVRSAAAKALRGRSDEKSLSLIERALGDPESAVRSAAAEALHGRSDGKSLSLIERALGDPKSYVRSGAAKALQGRSDEKSLALIERALGDPESYVRSGAAKALQGRSDEKSLALIERALDGPNPGTRSMAAEALRGRSDGRSFALIERALDDPIYYVRSGAVKALQGRSDEKSLALIERALGDPSPGVRSAAAEALRRRSDDRSMVLVSDFSKNLQFAGDRLRLKEILLTRRASNPLHGK